MFKNLVLLKELGHKEILTELKNVLMKKRALFVMLQYQLSLYLVPVESDTDWVKRSKDILDPLKISSEGFTENTGFRIMFDWLYESNGLREILSPHRSKSGLFWICDDAKTAVDLISILETDGKTDDDLTTNEFLVRQLIDDEGKKLETLSFNYCRNTEANETAVYLTSHYNAPFKSLGVADPIPNLVSHEYPVSTPEFAAVLQVWGKYWSDGKPGITKDALILELKNDGFSIPSAKAIDRVCRPEHARKGRRSKIK